MASDDDGLVAELDALVGARGLITAPGDIAPYLSDWRGLYQGRSPCVLRPADTAELAAAMRILARRKVPVVPQGGNTSMVGGAMPDESGRQVVLSLARLNRIRDIDPVDMTMVAEAGVVLKTAQDAAAEAGCLFPLSLGAEGSATIGGVLSTNAGPAVMQHIKAGKFKALAVGAPSRLDTLPNVPTLAELGYKSANMTSVFGIFAPAGVPAPILARLNAEVNKALALPDVRQRLEATDNVPTGGKAADFAKQIEAESRANAQIIKAAKIQLN